MLLLNSHVTACKLCSGTRYYISIRMHYTACVELDEEIV